MTTVKNPTRKENLQVENKEKQKIIHKGFPLDSEVQKMVKYAYDIGGMDLVKLIECENGSWNPFRQSTIIRNGVREQSYGLCQIHKKHHPNIINDSRFREDWKVQIEYCKELLDGGTKFYGPDRIIEGKRCYEYSEKRFLLGK